MTKSEAGAATPTPQEWYETATAPGNGTQAVLRPEFTMSSAIASSSTVSSKNRNHQRRGVPEALLQRYYPLPDVFNSIEEYQRFRHRDIPAMDATELHRELVRVEMRLLWDDNPHIWLFERREILRQALGQDRRHEA